MCRVKLKDRLVSMVDDDFRVLVAAHGVLDLMKLVYISFMKLAWWGVTCWNECPYGSPVTKLTIYECDRYIYMHGNCQKFLIPPTRDNAFTSQSSLTVLWGHMQQMVFGLGCVCVCVRPREGFNRCAALFGAWQIFSRHRWTGGWRSGGAKSWWMVLQPHILTYADKQLHECVRECWPPTAALLHPHRIWICWRRRIQGDKTGNICVVIVIRGRNLKRIDGIPHVWFSSSFPGWSKSKLPWIFQPGRHVSLPPLPAAAVVHPAGCAGPASSVWVQAGHREDRHWWDTSQMSANKTGRRKY